MSARAKARSTTGAARTRPAASPPEPDPRLATAAAVVVVMALAVVLGSVVLGPHRMGAFDVESDFYGGYAPAAQALAQGRLLEPDGRLPAVYGFVGPLYPLLLALGGLVHRDLFGVAELLSLLGVVGSVLAWFAIVRRRLGAWAGLATVVLLASNPVLFRYGYSATTDATALLLQSLSLLVLCSGRGGASALAAGGLAGLAFLTRYNSAYLLPAAVLIVALGGTEHAPRGRALVLYLAGALALALPWQLFARAHGAQPAFLQLFAYDLHGVAAGLDWDSFLQKVWPRYESAPLTVITGDPGAAAVRLGQNLIGHARADARLLFGPPLSWAALAAAALVFLDRRLLRLAPLAAAGLVAYVALLPAAHNERYSLILLPYVAAVAAAAIGARPLRLAASPWATAVSLLLLVAVALPAARASVRLQKHVLEQQPLETLRCAERLRALAQPGDRVVARKPHVAFIAGVGSVYFPPVQDLAGFAAHLGAERARWLFYSSAEVQLRPQWAFLLDTTAVLPGLTRRAYEHAPATLDGLDWQRIAVLVEVGPGFGTPPSWWADERVRALHTLRGLAAALPDARLQLRLARAEMQAFELQRAREAWSTALRVDPPGVGGWFAKFGGDTLRAVAEARF